MGLTRVLATADGATVSLGVWKNTHPVSNVAISNAPMIERVRIGFAISKCCQGRSWRMRAVVACRCG